MQLVTECPHCHTEHKIEEKFAGREMRCKACLRTFDAVVESGGQSSRTAKPRAATSLKTRKENPPDALQFPELNLTLVTIAPGTFRQGCSHGFATEQPTRVVTLSTPFHIGRCPITQAQFTQLMESNPSYFLGPDLPVEGVTWHDAMAFCQRLTELMQATKRITDGQYFRLPTEAEWEYCCRAGARKGSGLKRPVEDPEKIPEGPAYCFGDDLAKLTEYAWFDENSDEKTHPVGEKTPNQWGICDMHGNVSEWCHDWLAPYDKSAVTDPLGPDSGGRKVRRGGGWSSISARCRASDRVGVSPDCRCALLGFRVVLATGKPTAFTVDCRVY
jgi:predicted Zn finger-like uncharacterized protein